MYHDAPTFELRGIRRSDTNSLLRLYDRARGISAGSGHPHDRARADKAIERIVKELGKRNVTLGAVTPVIRPHVPASDCSRLQ